MDFAALIDRDLLRERLAAATGKGVRVGLLDSGVASGVPELEGAVRAHYEVVDDERGRPQIAPREFGDDVLDHGAANAHIILQEAPDAEIHSIQVLGSNHNTSSAKLLAALDFAIEKRWDVVNLSLGTALNFERFADIADRACYEGVLLVAAKANRPGEIGFPAGLSSVVGVDVEHFADPHEFRFYPGRCIEVEASGIYIEAPSSRGGWRQYTGTSFACPRVSGMVARLREAFPRMNAFELKVALSVLALPSDNSISQDFPIGKSGARDRIQDRA